MCGDWVGLGWVGWVGRGCSGSRRLQVPSPPLHLPFTLPFTPHLIFGPLTPRPLTLRTIARLLEIQDLGRAVVDREVANRAGGGREGRGDGGLGRDALEAVDGEGRARVEAVPSKPEEEGAKDDQGGVVAW